MCMGSSIPIPARYAIAELDELLEDEKFGSLEIMK